MVSNYLLANDLHNVLSLQLSKDSEIKVMHKVYKLPSSKNSVPKDLPTPEEDHKLHDHDQAVSDLKSI